MFLQAQLYSGIVLHGGIALYCEHTQSTMGVALAFSTDQHRIALYCKHMCAIYIGIAMAITKTCRGARVAAWD